MEQDAEGEGRMEGRGVSISTKICSRALGSTKGVDEYIITGRHKLTQSQLAGCGSSLYI